MRFPLIAVTPNLRGSLQKENESEGSPSVLWNRLFAYTALLTSTPWIQLEELYLRTLKLLHLQLPLVPPRLLVIRNLSYSPRTLPHLTKRIRTLLLVVPLSGYLPVATHGQLVPLSILRMLSAPLPSDRRNGVYVKALRHYNITFPALRVVRRYPPKPLLHPGFYPPPTRARARYPLKTARPLPLASHNLACRIIVRVPNVLTLHFLLALFVSTFVRHIDVPLSLVFRIVPPLPTKIETTQGSKNSTTRNVKNNPTPPSTALCTKIVSYISPHGRSLHPRIHSALPLAQPST